MRKQKPTKNRIAITIALSAILSALVAITTALIAIPIPATGGYINFGDTVIFATALTLGPLIAGLSGGIGSAISDAFLAPAFAPFTLIIKGFEGAIAGVISNRKAVWRDIIAVSAASVEVVVGYFLAEYFPLHIGIAAATEVPGNIIQVVVSSALGISIALVLRRTLPKSWTNQIVDQPKVGTA